MNISNSLGQILNSIQSSHSEHIFLQNLLYHITPLVQVFCQFSMLSIEYPNLGFNSYSLTFFVPMYTSCRTPLHHTTMWKFHSSPYITKCILLEMCLVCLVLSTFVAIHSAGCISNIMRGAFSGTIFGSLFRYSLFSTLKFDRSIPTVHAAL